MSSVTTVDEVIEREPFGRLQLMLVALISGAVIVDGFDIQAIAFIGPVLLKEWGLTRADLGPVITAALIGMVIGTPLGGRLGDRLGRRSALILSTAFFGLTTLVAALAADVNQLAVMRFISGLGFGALLPNATALVAEWMPSRFRSQAISLMIVGVPIGGMLGAAASPWLVENFGWRSCFVVGGTLGLLMAAALVVALPESLRFITKRSPNRKALVKLLNRAFGSGRFSESDAFYISELPRTSWSEIFVPQRLRATVGLSLAFFANLLAYYAFVSWMPTLLTSMGVQFEVALRGAFFFNLWGLPGALAGAALVWWRGSRFGLLVLLTSGILMGGILGFIINSPPIEPLSLMVALSIAGASVAGVQAGLYALSAAAYATHCRSTGVGFVSGIGRLGPVVSGLGGAFVLALSEGHTMFFICIVMTLLAAASGVLIVDRHTRPAT